MFNWIEYLTELFENNSSLNPHQLWDKAKTELTKEEKVLAFNQGAAKTDLSTRFHMWANSKSSFVESEFSFSVESKPSSKKASHVGGATYDEYGELLLVRNTHNEARNNKWVVFGEWTAEDWLSVEKYNYTMSDGYKKNAKWAHNAATILEDNGGLTKDYWKLMLDKLGPCPVIS